jgi:metal-sulfur cluster biosynthetic enzyme
MTEIMARLEDVTDPETDVSVVAMGFIDSVAESQGAVRVAFSLPTQWCGANFAFMMALDMRAALDALPWAVGTEVELRNHFAAARINRAVAARRDFAATFPGEAGDLDAVRARLRGKALAARQEMLLRVLLRDRGIGCLALSHDELCALGRGTDEAAVAARRFLALLSHGTDPPFRDDAGAKLTPATLQYWLRHTRATSRAAEANRAHCTLLMQAHRTARPFHSPDEAPGLYEVAC